MTQVAEMLDRLRRLAARREEDGIYTDAALIEQAIAALEPAALSKQEAGDDVAPLSCRLEDPVNIVDAATIDRVDRDARRLRQQIKLLAEVIMQEVDGEPSRSDEGAVDCAIRLLRQAYATPPASPVPAEPYAEGWRPIETAPKDGSLFLAWNKTVGAVVASIPASTAHYKKIEVNVNGSRAFIRPTHWLPLPPAPHGEGA